MKKSSSRHYHRSRENRSPKHMTSDRPRRSYADFHTSDETNQYRPSKKKSLGQHFLRSSAVVDHMIARVAIDAQTSVMEIGCGDGFLTRAILEQTPCARLWCYEIDREWASIVRTQIEDQRLTIHVRNILELDFAELLPLRPWVLLANLPYNITFPILFKVIAHRQLFTEGVVMVQEEVARKIVAQRGRGYGPASLMLQHHASWELMDKISPGSFSPPPKVFSRLLYFKPRAELPTIPDEQGFWQFVRFCFRSPRQTIKNNLRTTHFRDIQLFDVNTEQLRAQQLAFEDFLKIWQNYLQTRPTSP